MKTNKVNTTSFQSGVHVYFYTNKGKRILSDDNMKKCIHYMEAHLNRSKRVKTLNQDLVDTFTYGQLNEHGNRIGGDRDYWNIPKIRTVIDNTDDKVQGFMNVVTGADAEKVSEKYGKPIGRAKSLSRRRSDSNDSFETSWAVKNYINGAPEHAESNPIINGNGERMAFGIIIEPVKVDKNGVLKKFNYVRSGYFEESKVTGRSRA